MTTRLGPRGASPVPCRVPGLFRGAHSLWLAWLTGAAAVAGPLSAPNGPDFAPVLVRTEFSQHLVQPGDSFLVWLHFRNDGLAPARADYTVFLHFEGESSCESIAFQRDHSPAPSTRLWRPGQAAVDGPIVVHVPHDIPEQTYQMHVGLFDRNGDQSRVLDAMSGEVRITLGAPHSLEWDPDPLTREDVVRRRVALGRRLIEPVVLEAAAGSFALDRESGAFLLWDQLSGTLWSSNTSSSRWGLVFLMKGRERRELVVERFDTVELAPGRLEAHVNLVVEAGEPPLELTVTVETIDAGMGFRIRTDLENPTDWQVTHFTGLDRAFATSDAQGGYGLVPRWLGELAPTDRGMPVGRLYPASELSMFMSGAVKDDSALLLAWEDPGISLLSHLSVEDSPLVAGRRTRSLSLWMTGEARTVELWPLGKGDYVDIARAYRAVAQARGFRETWAEKRARHPALERLEGAPVLRLTGMQRVPAGTPLNLGPDDWERTWHTFDEIAQCAKHWREQLDIERAHVLVAGWNRDGYDNAHPDVLPANAACGGDAGLARCAQEVEDLGYVFGLHDNYQDIYRRSPSWDEQLVNVDGGGALRRGGVWSGGQSYRVCSVHQIEFARRNLPQVRERFAPDSYFLDTTLTTRLEGCAHPDHPMTLEDDRRHRIELFEYARERFGILGLEGMREWAVPSAHFFEGALMHLEIESPTWDVVPLFPIVFGDCVELLTRNGAQVGPGDAARVLDHLLYAAVPMHDPGPQLYFEVEQRETLAVHPVIVGVEPMPRNRVRLELDWEVRGDLDRDYSVFVHFTHSDDQHPENTVFQDDFVPDSPTSTWREGQQVRTSTHTLAVPRPGGPWDIRVGLAEGGERRRVQGASDREGRHLVGQLRWEGTWPVVEPAPETSAQRVFARGDRGWGQDLGPSDRLIKNCYELISPLARLVAGHEVTGHRFLSADHSVERMEFGDVTVTVNYGESEVGVGEARLGPYGVLVLSPTFIAFHAVAFRGVLYPGGALFTLRSLDGRPLSESREVRVYHGFGDPRISLGERVISVERERTLHTTGD